MKKIALALLVFVCALLGQAGQVFATESSTSSAVPNKCVVTVTSMSGGEVKFTVPEGCAKKLSLVSYSAPSATYDVKTADQQKLFDSKTVKAGAGSYAWKVKLPECFYQLDFVYGDVLPKLGPDGSGNFYLGSLIKATNGGKVCDDTVTTTVPPTTTIVPTTVTTQPVLTSSTVVTTPPTTQHISTPMAQEEQNKEALASTGFSWVIWSIIAILFLATGLAILWSKNRF